MRKLKSLISLVSILIYGKFCYAADTWKLTSEGSGGISQVSNQVNSTMKAMTDSLLPVASIVSVVIAGGFIMFSSQSGWKRLINAAIGSAIAFGAVMVVGSIYKSMSS